MKTKSKKGTKGGARNYFSEIYAKMQEDEAVSFWDLVPIQNTFFGRIVSHVIFRSVGVSLVHYMKDHCKKKRLTVLDEDISSEDRADLEFLCAWNNIQQSYASLYKEALAFRDVLEDRDYELWLVQTLSKIPKTQWEKQKQKFVFESGNPLYIVVFSVWYYMLQGFSLETVFSKLPKDLTAIENYVLSRTVKGYDLAEELQQTIETIRSDAENHGHKVLDYTKSRVQKLFNCVRNPVNLGLTEVGKQYYKQASVLWGLWALSTKEVLSDNTTLEEALPSLANSLVCAYDDEMCKRMRMAFIAEWMYRYDINFLDTPSDEAEDELEKVLAELESVKRELSKEKAKCKQVERDLQKQKGQCDDLLREKSALSKQNQELQTKLKVTQKKLAVIPTEVQQEKKESLLEQPVPIRMLEKKVIQLQQELTYAHERIDDIFTLLSLTDDVDDTDAYSMTEDDSGIGNVYDVALKEFKGRVILNGGAKTWQERVRKWFEAHGVKVRIYALGASVAGVRSSDVVLLNVINNKHKYSFKFMSDIRKSGAKLNVCKVNNVEQTLKIVFGHQDKMLC